MPTKVCLVKGMVFRVVMYACERWTLKKESWTLKEIHPEYSLEGLMLKLEKTAKFCKAIILQ